MLCSLGHVSLRETLRTVPRKEENGDEAFDMARLSLLPFACINFGRLRAHATMNPRDTSASVQRPMKSPLWDTSASEMTGAILTVKTMRIAEAAQALSEVSYALECVSVALQQTRGEKRSDSYLPPKRHIKPPQARSWKK